MYLATVHTTRGSMSFEFCRLEDWERFFDAEYLRAKLGSRADATEFFCPEEVSHVIFSTLSGRRFKPEELEKALGVEVRDSGKSLFFKVDGREVIIHKNRYSFTVKAPDFTEKEKKFEKFWLSMTL